MRRTAVTALALGAAAVGAVVLVAGDDPYTVSVALENASGLKDGSEVKVGGLNRGTVDVRVDDRDRVILDLELDDEVGRVGKDASVAIVAANFLGRKRVELTPGDARANPAPGGYVLSSRQVTTPTDLDQLLGVFDPDTRARAQILLGAAGEAVVGRKVDVRRLLRELPLGMEQAGPALAELATTDRVMDDLVVRSDRFVAEAARERRALSRLIGALADTGTTVAARRTALREALRRTPGTLRTLRGFLGDLEATAGDLGPAARRLTAAAPPLADTLGRVEAFREAAAPTLRTATGVAPSLSRLATRSTPVLRRARPTVASLATLAGALPPVTKALDNSADNVIAVLENWSRAIQLRDQLGHVFRGEASFSPDLILTMVDRMSGAGRRATTRRRPAAAPPRPAAREPQPADRPRGERPRRLPKVPGLDEVLRELPGTPTVDQVTDALQDALGGLGAGGRDGGAATPQLLDFLLGP
ncbi:MAG TPA: MlaD family protein [Baekduia sp.]|nr:MlaD family protein [Baekduia sp.]